MTATRPLPKGSPTAATSFVPAASPVTSVSTCRSARLRQRDRLRLRREHGERARAGQCFRARRIELEGEIRRAMSMAQPERVAQDIVVAEGNDQPSPSPHVLEQCVNLVLAEVLVGREHHLNGVARVTRTARRVERRDPPLGVPPEALRELIDDSRSARTGRVARHAPLGFIGRLRHEQHDQHQCDDEHEHHGGRAEAPDVGADVRRHAAARLSARVAPARANPT